MSPSPTPRRSSKPQVSPGAIPKLSPAAAPPATSPPSRSPRHLTPLAPATSSAAHTTSIPQKPPTPEPDTPTKKRKTMEPSPMAPPASGEVEMKDASGSAPPSAPSAPEATPERPAKKSRTNTPWTPAEEKRLKIMRDESKTWSEIAKMFPNRTEGSVKKHWYKDMHYADFAEDESQALLQAIKEYDANKWKVIGQKVGKPAKACEQYAKENFSGRI